MHGPGPVEGVDSDPVRGSRRRVVDLGIAVDRQAGVPLPDQLERQLRALLARRELAPGDPLPSTRAFAADLAVSRGVVVEAYDRLVRQGVLVAQRGGVVRVSPTVRPEPSAQSHAGDEAPAAREYTLDLHAANTPIGTFDRRAWSAALRAALREATEPQLTSLDSAGVLELREALAVQLARSRGVVAPADQIVVTGGVSDGLQGLTPLLRERGGRVAVEDPGFGLHRATLIGSGLELVPVRTDRDGINIAALQGERVAAVLVTPAHQMPLGVPLSPERRTQLVEWSRRTGALILEDDYDGELRYDRLGVRSLHGLAPDRVIYLGTTSKVLSAAVRVGWIVAPRALIDELLAWRLASGGAPSNVVQVALAEYLRSGAFDRGIARLRRCCAAQRDAMRAALEQELPGLRQEGVAAGLQIAVRVPQLEPWRLLVAAQERGIRAFATDDGPDALLLVGFGLVEPPAAPRVAREVAAVIAAARDGATV